MTSPDRRSVGELLAECDLSTRRLLFDPGALDAAAMVRTWPEVVQTAHELLDALPTANPVTRPGKSGGGVGGGGDLTGERLHLMATALDLNLRRRVWPGAVGPADAQLLTVVGNLQRAHDLVRRHLRVTDTPAPAVLTDAEAARTKILHTLYVGAHAISLAVRAQIGEARFRQRTVSVTQHRGQLTALHVAQSRLAAFEQVAGTEVYRTFPAATTGEHRERPAPDRLSSALAGWDIQAHRALAKAPSMAHLAEVTRVHATTLALTRVVLAAAAAHFAIDSRTHRAQLEPRLSAAESAWGTLHATVRDLTGHAHRNVNPDLRTAGAELVHALSEMVLDGTAVADATTIAKRVDLASTARTLTDALDSPQQISMILIDAALDPRTRVSARAAQQLLGQLYAGPETSPQSSWLDPRDLAAGREVAPPGPIRAAIIGQAHDVEATSHALAGFVTAVHGPNTASSSDSPGQEGAPPVRTLHRSVPAPARAAGTMRR